VNDLYTIGGYIPMSAQMMERMAAGEPILVGGFNDEEDEMTDDPLLTAARHALRHFVHLDEANAAIHCAEVRYSPLTFRLAEALAADDVTDADSTVARVLAHVGAYAEDPGR
jgi:hypothetical protein